MSITALTPEATSSEWAVGPVLETAARYVAAVRHAPGPVARGRAALSPEGLGAIGTLLRSLPTVAAPFSDAPGGRELHAWFRPSRRLPIDRAPVALLRLPATNLEYLRGRPRQALRTNVRRASEAGAVCTVVACPTERARAVQHLAARRGQQVDSMVSTGTRVGLVRETSLAYDRAGDPVALCESVVDGEWAGLGVFVTAPDHPDTRAVRYLLHAHTVERLIDRGTTMLVVGGSMLLTSQGTRYFQQRTGFTPVWIRPSSGPPRCPAAARP